MKINTYAISTESTEKAS